MIKSRKCFKTFIYFIRHGGSVLRIGEVEFPDTVLDILIRENGVIIWENQGIFRLIPAPILHNIWLTCEASQQLKKEYTRIEGADSLKEISWNQGIVILPIIVNNLLLIPHENSINNKIEKS